MQVPENNRQRDRRRRAAAYSPLAALLCCVCSAIVITAIVLSIISITRSNKFENTVPAPPCAVPMRRIVDYGGTNMYHPSPGLEFSARLVEGDAPVQGAVLAFYVEYDKRKSLAVSGPTGQFNNSVPSTYAEVTTDANGYATITISNNESQTAAYLKIFELSNPAVYESISIYGGSSADNIIFRPAINDTRVSNVNRVDQTCGYENGIGKTLLVCNNCLIDLMFIRLKIFGTGEEGPPAQRYPISMRSNDTSIASVDPATLVTTARVDNFGNGRLKMLTHGRIGAVTFTSTTPGDPIPIDCIVTFV